MRNETVTDKKPRGRPRSNHVLTPEQTAGIFSYTLKEIARHFEFRLVPIEGGVQLNIQGLRHVAEPDGTWRIEPITIGQETAQEAVHEADSQEVARDGD
jgi:hypothetical protein